MAKKVVITNRTNYPHDVARVRNTVKAETHGNDSVVLCKCRT